jgi:hypothetical protein
MLLFDFNVANNNFMIFFTRKSIQIIFKTVYFMTTIAGIAVACCAAATAGRN